MQELITFTPLKEFHEYVLSVGTGTVVCCQKAALDSILPERLLVRTIRRQGFFFFIQLLQCILIKVIVCIWSPPLYNTDKNKNISNAPPSRKSAFC